MAIFATIFRHLAPIGSSHLNLWRDPMQHLVGGYRGLSLIVDLNWDRLFYLAAVGGALFAAAFVASL